MKAKKGCFILRPSVMAVHGALIAMALMPAAYAADAGSQDSAANLTKQQSVFEVGVGNVSRDSFKYGEFNGLNKEGPYAIGNFDLRGGSAYDSGGTQRWRVQGTDLGLDTRSLSVDYGNQGTFRLNFGYDEWLRNRSDTYQTPYNGAGTNNLTLPAAWVKPTVPQLNANLNFRGLDPTAGSGSYINAAGVLTAPTAAQLAAGNAMRAADLPAFHNVNLFTKRQRYDGGLSFNIDRQWTVDASYRHEHKDGMKPMGTVSSQVREFSATIPDLIDQDTDQFNASVNYKGDKGFMQVAYYGSLFRNGVSSMTWQDVNNLANSATMSSAPSNQFHQLGVTGGYDFSTTTRLVMNGSYARNTQNDSYQGAGQLGMFPAGYTLPAGSLNGEVITKSFNMKLTARPAQKLNVAAAYKYDDRDNKTPVNVYQFYDANEGANATVNPFTGLPGANLNFYNNRAYSKKINQFNLDANYAVKQGHTLSAGYEYQKIDRHCNGSWIDCADANTTKEDTWKAEWRAQVRDDLTGRINYAYSQRRVDFYNENSFLSLTPMANVIPTFGAGAGATTSAYGYLLQTGLTGFGPFAPYAANVGNANIFSPGNNILPQALYASRNNINELIGMRRFNMADRNRDKLRTALNWDATERLSFQGGVDFNQDQYSNSVYGLQSARGWALNLDGTFTAADDLTFNVFYTHEDQRSKTAGDAYGTNNNGLAGNSFVGQAGNTLVSGGCFGTRAAQNQNAKVDPCLNWGTDMHDQADTLGLQFTKKGLMAGRLALNGNVIYTRATTDNSVSGGSYVNNPYALAAPAPALAAGVPAVLFIPASPLPTVTTNIITGVLAGNYSLDKVSAVRVAYSYSRLTSSDYAYDGLQYGSVGSVMPTSEKAPAYVVQVIGVSYVRKFW